MKKTTHLIVLAMAAAIALAGIAGARPAAADLKSVADVKSDMRKLWEDHITYTRNYIISALAGLPDTDTIANRLFRNQDEIGTAIKPYYGDAAGNKLAALLKDHISIAAEVVKAAKAGNNDQLAEQQKKWGANADDIAKFLSGANSNWKEADLKNMLHRHLDLTTAEVTSRLKKDWVADEKAYDDGHVHMLMFSDALTEGIAKQYPDKFAK